MQRFTEYTHVTKFWGKSVNVTEHIWTERQMDKVIIV